MVASGAVPALLHLLHHGGSEEAEAAALALSRIVQHWPTGSHTALLHTQAVLALITQLQHSSMSVQTAAAWALATAATLGAAADIVDAGAVPVLPVLCMSRDSALQAEAACAIGNLAAVEPDGCASAAAQLMPLLVRLLGSGRSINARSDAARALGNLIHNSPARSVAAAAAGAGPVLVAALHCQARLDWQEAQRQIGRHEAMALEAGVLSMLVLNCPDSRAAIVAAGGAAALQQAASSANPCDRSNVTDALAALEAEPAARADNRWASGSSFVPCGSRAPVCITCKQPCAAPAHLFARLVLQAPEPCCSPAAANRRPGCLLVFLPRHPRSHSPGPLSARVRHRGVRRHTGPQALQRLQGCAILQRGM